MCDSKLTPFENFDQVPDNLKANQIQPGMFSDPKFNTANNLHRCIRMLPHHNNDGGFFAALIRKTRPLPWESDEWQCQKLLDKHASLFSSRLRKKFLKLEPKKTPLKMQTKVSHRKIRQYFVDKSSFFKFDSQPEKLRSIIDFYGLVIKPESCFLPESGKNIYVTNEAIKNFVMASNKSHNIFLAGLKIMTGETKSASNVTHTLTIAGRHLLVPFVTQRTAHIERDDFVQFVEAVGANENGIAYKNIFSCKSAQAVQSVVDKSGYGPIRLVSEEVDIFGFVGEKRLSAKLKPQEIYHLSLLLSGASN